MLSLKHREDGVTVLIGVLLVVVIAVVGAVALKTGEAYWSRRRPSRPTSSNISNYTNTGATATCTVNGRTIPSVNGTCRATSVGTQGTASSTCIVNGQSIPLVDGKCTFTSKGQDGANGTTSTTVVNEGQSICTVNGQTVPCQ